MAYTPPPPGRSKVGEPTPPDLVKQDAHIKDMPPEVRRSFLLSMVFFPSIVGAGICAVLFLSFWFLRTPKNADRYALELQNGITSGNKRTRWQAARRIAENLNSKEVANKQVLTALLAIVNDPSMDEEVEAWSPSMLIRNQAEGSSRLRWWAAYLVGHIAARLNDVRGREALTRVLTEQNEKDPPAAAGLRFFAAAGLGVLKDHRAVESLAAVLNNEKDAVVRAACVKALGSIGAGVLAVEKESDRLAGWNEALGRVREALQEAYLKDADTDVKWNAAIALARVGDGAGRKTLDELVLHKDPVIQRNAKQAIEILDKGSVDPSSSGSPLTKQN